MAETLATIHVGTLLNAKKSIDQARTRLRTARAAGANQAVLLDSLESDLELVEINIRLGLEGLSPIGEQPEPASWLDSWKELYAWLEAQIKQAPALGADQDSLRRLLWKMNRMEMAAAGEGTV